MIFHWRDLQSRFPCFTLEALFIKYYDNISVLLDTTIKDKTDFNFSFWK